MVTVCVFQWIPEVSEVAGTEPQSSRRTAHLCVMNVELRALREDASGGVYG